jgi:hypothetical protein
MKKNIEALYIPLAVILFHIIYLVGSIIINHFVPGAFSFGWISYFVIFLRTWTDPVIGLAILFIGFYLAFFLKNYFISILGIFISSVTLSVLLHFLTRTYSLQLGINSSFFQYLTLIRFLAIFTGLSTILLLCNFSFIKILFNFKSKSKPKIAKQEYKIMINDYFEFGVKNLKKLTITIIDKLKKPKIRTIALIISACSAVVITSIYFFSGKSKLEICADQIWNKNYAESWDKKNYRGSYWWSSNNDITPDSVKNRVDPSYIVYGSWSLDKKMREIDVYKILYQGCEAEKNMYPSTFRNSYK